MKIGRLKALRILFDANRGVRLSVKAHIIGRFLTCPFPAILEHCLKGGRLLDIGAGHGSFARLALATGTMSAVAVEPDLRKVFHVEPQPNLHFLVGFDAAVQGKFDCISMIDVLYKMPIVDWDDLFVRIRKRLGPNGVFLLKEIDPTHRVKNGWNRFQELIASTLDVTLGESFSYEPPDVMVERLERAGFVSIETKNLGRGYPHAHILYIARC